MTLFSISIGILLINDWREYHLCEIFLPTEQTSLEAKLILLSKQPSRWAGISVHWNLRDSGRAISKAWSHWIIPHSVLNTKECRPDLHYPLECTQSQRQGSASEWTHIGCSIEHTVSTKIPFTIWTKIPLQDYVSVLIDWLSLFPPIFIYILFCFPYMKNMKMFIRKWGKYFLHLRLINLKVLFFFLKVLFFKHIYSTHFSSSFFLKQSY